MPRNVSRNALGLASLAAILAVSAGTVAAQNVDAIKARKEILKSMGKPTKELAGMMKGEVPFDLSKVKQTLQLYQTQAPKLPPLFPPDSKTGGETEALPVIWDKKKDFEGRYAKLASDAKAAEATIKDEKSFKANIKEVVGNCGGCHKIYREEK